MAWTGANIPLVLIKEAIIQESTDGSEPSFSGAGAIDLGAIGKGTFKFNDDEVNSEIADGSEYQLGHKTSFELRILQIKGFGGTSTTELADKVYALKGKNVWLKITGLDGTVYKLKNFVLKVTMSIADREGSESGLILRGIKVVKSLADAIEIS